MSDTVNPARAVDPRGNRARLRRMVTAMAVLAALAAAADGLTWLAVPPDATNRLRDDAFYEFAWAANLAAGRGPMVSDGTTTSGVQLLWSLLLVPLALVFGAGGLPVVAPWVGTALHAATALLWARACRDRLTGFVVAACWLGHPLLVRESQNGQETALACLLASGLWFARRSGAQSFTALGVLAVLARSDLLALVAMLAWWRHRHAPLRALAAPAIAFAVHAAANLSLGAGILPDSAMPMPWLVHGNHELAAADAGARLHGAWWYLRPALFGGPWALASAFGCALAVFLVARPFWPARLRVLPALAVGGAAAFGARELAIVSWTAVLFAVLPASRPRGSRSALPALLVGLGAIVVLHWAVRWYPRDYYIAPVAVVAFAALQRVGRCRVLLLLFALSMLVDRGRLRPEPLAGQLEMAIAGAALHHVLPEGERVGCFNSGLVTFLADVTANGRERRGVVNLDGVVDGRSFAALRAGRLDDWLDAEGVRFLVDNEVQFARDPKLPHACGHWFGPDFDAARDLVEVARFDVPGVDNGRPGGDSMRLYWRRGRGDPPPRLGAARDLGDGPCGTRLAQWPAQAGDVLELAVGDGERRPLLAVDVATTVVVAVPLPPRSAGRLFVAGRPEPVLVLAPR
mgnify:CR=1 FL=1